ncbi:MAG TPA: DUF4149 domain-containing protein [Candidatus Acidoferrum sp.]|nr:DUF4149 domain-containing protein [Candidatus Acidoferrum sp.]
MTNILRFVQVFAIGTWVGSIIFFSFVVAPSLFTALGNRDDAGAVVRLSLFGMHHYGVVMAILYLIAGVWLARSARWFISPAAIAVILMLAFTVASQYVVIPRMDALRTQMGSIAATPAESPLRKEFDHLHGVSVDLEAGVLFVGMIAIYFTARKERA